jgi:hypothetical protein
MKIRLGFVSNSSTSSFCIFGLRIDGEEISGGKECELISLCNKIGLKWQRSLYDTYNDNDQTFFVGVNAVDMPRDKTLEQIEKDIKEKLIGQVPPELLNTQLMWHEQAAYDG